MEITTMETATDRKQGTAYTKEDVKEFENYLELYDSLEDANTADLMDYIQLRKGQEPIQELMIKLIEDDRDRLEQFVKAIDKNDLAGILLSFRDSKEPLLQVAKEEGLEI